ncbi:hypothetical protein [Geminicoccus harenae]|uniref:hypothetical protein n=1 Tax=Geminicoccus harenae TaxID=2498453 RepID=UPI00168BC71B|nr:hypothetical protein [Geminicoccus harenae]
MSDDRKKADERLQFLEYSVASDLELLNKHQRMVLETYRIREEHWKEVAKASAVIRAIDIKVSLSRMDAEHEEPDQAKNDFSVPVRAEKFLYLITPREQRDAIAGDLMEAAAKLSGKFGPSYAQRWYWVEVTKITCGRLKGVVTLGAVLAVLRSLRGFFTGG